MQEYRVHTTKTAARLRAELADEFKRWADMRRVRGIPWSEAGSRSSRSAEIVYTLPGDTERTLTHGKQQTYEDNLAVLALAIHDLRMAEKRGFSEVLAQHFAALPAPRTPFDVLGVRNGAVLAEVANAYHTLAKRYHPDSGTEPNTAKMAEINAAYEQLTKAGAQ